jgi:Cu(I)/Ag(I) efflux system periplasmic protein CusF
MIRRGVHFEGFQAGGWWGAVDGRVGNCCRCADAAIIGEVKKIDEGSRSITLKQGPAPSLGFKEDMTLIYEVKDRAMLKQVKVGDTVKFEAESGDSGFMITRIQKSR